jgi:branched-chain amino acid transport system permease protein
VLEQQLVNGVMLGAVYILVAVSFTLSWGLLNFINFSIPGLFMLGGFGLWALGREGLPFPLAVIGALLLAGATAFVVERFTYRMQRTANPVVPLVSSLGFLILIENLATVRYGSDARTVQVPFDDANLRIGEVVLSVPHLASLAGALVLVAVTHAALRRSQLGRGVRAIAENADTAHLLGVRIDRLVPLIFIAGGLFTGLAGLAFALSYQQVSPFMGDQIALKGVSAMVIGGMGNLWGAVAGGLLIGVLEVLATHFFGADFINVIAYGTLLLVVLLRPQGLFAGADAAQEKL